MLSTPRRWPGRWRRKARVARRQLADLVDASSDAVVLLDADGCVERTNESFTRLTGIPCDAALGRPLDDVLDPIRIRDAEHQTRLRHLVDGTIRTVRHTHRPLLDGARPTGATVTFTDVTRQHEVATLKADFVSRVSHELRTPLTPIAGFARMLLARGTALDADMRATALERIVERADHLACLVDDLLQVAELQDPASARPELRPVRLARAVSWALAGVEARHPDRVVRTALQEDTASADVLAWPDGLITILTHLVDNALRYSPPDTVVDVVVRRPGDGEVEVAISDRGRGIPVADREAVFDAFHRLDDPLHMTTSGIGVGLFIARNLARSMGGDVACRSHPGPGVTFTLQLRTERSLSPESDTPTYRPADQRRMQPLGRNM